jgi:N6-adenosine-specific RNA methylase IME4
MGYLTRNCHELLLVGTRGSGMLPEAKDRPPSVVEARRGRHSEKPEIFHELIEAMYSGRGIRRIELFARQARRGWTAWGNEVEQVEPRRRVA